MSPAYIWNPFTGNLDAVCGGFINPDGSVRVQVATSNRLIWDTDIDWNKGTHGPDIEVSGTYESAVIWPNVNNDFGDVTYNNASDYTLSSGTDLEIAGGKAALKSTATNYDWPFTTPSDYTYGSDITVTGGAAQLTSIPTDPYAWYHLNESSGTSAADSSTHGRTGTTVNSPSWVAGKLNNGLQLNGTTQYVDLGNIASFERTDSFSAEAWIYITDLTSNRGIISRMKATSPYNGWAFFVAGSKLKTQIINTFSSNLIDISGSTTLSINTWYHVVLTYDGTSTAAGTKLYLNGVLETPTVNFNSLSATIITTENAVLGKAYAGGDFFKGIMDECVIYPRVINQAEVTFRYNSGTGTETMPNVYPTTVPAIYDNTGASFGSFITAFVETSTKPALTEIKYQVSSDDGATWKYWTGSAWATSNLTYAQANLASDINTNISTLASSGTFRFRAMLSTTSIYATPLLDQVRITRLSYSTTDNLYVDTKNASQIVTTGLLNYTYLTVTDTLPASGDIKLLFSTDSRANWLTWNGSAWAAPGDPTLRSNATTITDAGIHLSSIPIGSGTLDIRLFIYSSDSLFTPAIDNIRAGYTRGFYTSAHYETNVFNSTVLSQGWGIFDAVDSIPAGTTITFKARSSNFTANMGSYGSALIVGDPLNTTGQYIQFSVDFTGTVSTRSSVNSMSVRYETPFIQDVNP